MGLHLKLKPSKGHGNSRSDVVTERDRAKEVSPIDAEELSCRQGSRHDSAAGMRMRWGVRVVGLVSMGQHAIHQSRFRGTAQQIRPYNRRSLLSSIGAGEVERDFRRRQLRPRHHRRKSVQDMFLCLLSDVRRKNAGLGLCHVPAQFVHHVRRGRAIPWWTHLLCGDPPRSSSAN